MKIFVSVNPKARSSPNMFDCGHLDVIVTMKNNCTDCVLYQVQIALFTLHGNGCHGDRCALRQTTLYCGWLLPMSIIILHNLVVFGLVLRVLCRKQPGGIHYSKPHSDVILLRIYTDWFSPPFCEKTERCLLLLAITRIFCLIYSIFFE